MDDLEKAFLNSLGDAYAIYQLKQTQDTRDLRFASMGQVLMAGKKIDREKYELLYIGDLPGKMGRQPGDVLDEIYARFNIMKPTDFTGHSLSMSDIIGLKQNGSISFHYVDTFGFREVKDFLPDNLLHSAEIGMEDDYNQTLGVLPSGARRDGKLRFPRSYTMIDGIVGNNGRNPALEERKPAITKPEDRLPLREQLRHVMRENTGKLPQAKEARKTSFER
ncbi:MAG: hypothetical protein IK099_06785 [Clostridia bacterium]|nr:hypothetical protein [Clostridia bacterium]